MNTPKRTYFFKFPVGACLSAVLTAFVPWGAEAPGKFETSKASTPTGDEIDRSHPPGSPGAGRSGTELLARLPLAFVENRGQWEGPARFVARRGGATVWCLPDSLTLQLVRRESRAEEAVRGVNVRMVFEGARGAAALQGREELPTLYNYFFGSDPARWRTEVKGYERLVYTGLHEGVDLVVREGSPDLEYDLLLTPGADLEAIVVRVDGAEGALRLDEQGALVIGTALGAIRQPTPTAWEEEVGGERRPFDCSYRLLGENRFGFRGRERTAGLALVVDPGLVYSTFLGGSVNDEAHAVVLDGTGAAVVVGRTTSPDFPVTAGAYTTGNWDAFVTRLPLTGGPPSYSTFLGGGREDVARAVAIDATGAAVVAGSAEIVYSGSQFPTTQGAYDTTHNGVLDVFVTRLSLTGGPLLYSTFLGGMYSDEPYDLVLDAAGAAVLVGKTGSFNFPVTQGTFNVPANLDAFVTWLPLTGSPPSYSTFLGGPANDAAFAVALDGTGAAVVAGATASLNFPTTTGAYDTTYNGGGTDVFVTRLPLSGGSATYSTFLGGSEDDEAHGVSIDATGDVVVAGITAAVPVSVALFPVTVGAYDTTHNGGFDVFVTRLPLTGGSLNYSTFLGGWAHEGLDAVLLDAIGTAVVVGTTQSAPFLPGYVTFPTTPGAYDPTHNGNADVFVTRLPLTGGPLLYSTLLGGWLDDVAKGATLDAMGAAVVTGYTNSLGAPGFVPFPTTPGAYDPTFNGGSDAFVAHLDLLPSGASAFGASTPGCMGPLAIGVTSIPQVGNAAFALTCGNAPPNSTGLLAFSGAPVATPLVFLGAEIWIDLGSPAFFTVFASSDAVGAAQVPIPIPNVPGLAGAQVFVQFFWAGPSSPPPCPPLGVSASGALAITVQP